MATPGEQIDLFHGLAQTAGNGVLHLPYTAEFEAACLQTLGHAPSVEEKHELWEKLLQLQSTTPAATPAAQQSTRHITFANAGSTGAPGVVEQPVKADPSLNHSSEVADDQSVFTASLFEGPSVKSQQPWSAPVQHALSTDVAEERARMLADIANSRLGTTEQRVAYLLSRFPETRDSDIALCISYWRRFQADVLERWDPLELEVLFELDKLETIGRIRRHVQHKLQLFRGMEDIADYRDFLQKEFHEYLTAHSGALPEVRFYFDETGNEGDKAFVGVGGICVINWQQYEKHHAAIAQWRRDQGWAETIHFVETGIDKLDRAVRLLAELQSRRSGLLFLGHSVQSRGRTHQDFVSLFIQLVIDSLQHLKRIGCLEQSRSIRIIKEQDSGFDSIYLEKMHKQLSDLVAIEFPGQAVVQPIETLIKGREVFLECADLIAGGMQRRALFKGRNPKDKLAEAVVNVTGFEDAADPGALFKSHNT